MAYSGSRTSSRISRWDCIKVGLYAYNEKANSPITATFSNVSVNGVPVGAVGGSGTTTFLDQDWGGFEQSVPAPSISLYPNPARELVNLNLTQVMGEPATIRIFNINGQLMDQLRFDAIEEATAEIDIAEATGRYVFCECTDDEYVSVAALCEAVGYSRGTRSYQTSRIKKRNAKFQLRESLCPIRFWSCKLQKAGLRESSYGILHCLKPPCAQPAERPWNSEQNQYQTDQIQIERCLELRYIIGPALGAAVAHSDNRNSNQHQR
jgi:hypothetical protein